MSDLDITESGSLSRRRLLTGLAGAAGLATGAGLVLPSGASASTVDAESAPWGLDGLQDGLLGGGAPTASSDVTAAAMISRNYLKTSGCHLYYEPSGSRTSFTFNETFYNRLGYWKTWANDNAPSSWGWPSRIDSYGAYVNKPGYHGSGRAFDIANVRFKNSDGVYHWLWCRYDVWKSRSNAAMWRRRYWALAASLVRRFSYVITYPYNSAHHNHIHVDNAVYSLMGDTYFNPNWSTQVYIVQACCRYIWGKGTAVDGIYGPETTSHSISVLRRIGRSSGSLTSRSNWIAFNTASYRKGVGTQAY